MPSHTCSLVLILPRTPIEASGRSVGFPPVAGISCRSMLSAAMPRKRTYFVVTAIYLLSFGILLSFVVMLLVGLMSPTVLAFANKIALPTVIGSVVCLETFKRLAWRAARSTT